MATAKRASLCCTPAIMIQHALAKRAAQSFTQDERSLLNLLQTGGLWLSTHLAKFGKAARTVALIYSELKSREGGEFLDHVNLYCDLRADEDNSLYIFDEKYR